MTQDNAGIIKQAVDIRSVVELYGVTPNARGVCTCPFHDDRHPSASIKKGYFHCYVCNLHLDIFAFVQQMTGCTFPQAIAQINSVFHIVDLDKPVDVSALRRIKDEQRRRRAERDRYNAEYDRLIREHQALYQTLITAPPPAEGDDDGAVCYAEMAARLAYLEHYFEDHHYRG